MLTSVKTHRVVAMGISAVLLSSFGASSAQAQVFEIVSVSSGQVLDVPGFSTASGIPIQQWPENDGANQEWWIWAYPESCGLNFLSANSDQMMIQLPPTYTGYATLVLPGTQIRQWPSDDGYDEQFLIKQVPGSGSDTVEIVSTEGGLVLDVPGFSTTRGTRIQAYPENDGNNQQWLLAPAPHQNPTTISVAGKPGSIFSGGTITVSGHSSTYPGAQLGIVLMGVPNESCMDYLAQIVTVKADGTYSFTRTVPITSTNPNDANNFVTVGVTDSWGYALAFGAVSAAYWTSY